MGRRASFPPSGPFTLARIAEACGGRLRDEAVADRLVADVASLDAAAADCLVHLSDPGLAEMLDRHPPGACIVPPGLRSRIGASHAVILADDPRRAFALAARLFHPRSAPEPYIAPSAVIEAGAVLGPGCRVEAGAVIQAGVVLGEKVHVGANAVLGPDVELGDGVVIGPLASVRHARIGAFTTIFSGARIGEAGFGFVPDPPRGHLRLPQLGLVLIGRDCEVGANSTIDRGGLADTVIGDGSIIDNLVQIGHNTHLGRGCVLAGQVGISGSVTVGDFVVFGGQAGIADHLEIGSGGRVAARAGVMRDVPAGGTVAGSPAMPIKEHMRQVATLARLAQRRDDDG